MAAVAAVYQQFKRLNAEVLAISTDSVYSHKVFTEVSKSLSNVTYPMISDRSHQISKAYKVLNEETGTSLRATLIIDPNGMISARLINPTEVGRNIYEILRLLEGIQYSLSKGEVVPANWIPGQTGIKRDPSWIGNI